MIHSQAIGLASLLAFAFLVNLPLGFLRESTAKYSLRWFVYIHLSIPFIVAFRLAEGLGWNIVPLTLACAIAGQLTGGRIHRWKKR